MRIGLDATRIFLPTGEGTYTHEVIRHLLDLGTDDTFLLLIPRDVEEFDRPNVTQHHYSEVDGMLRRLQYTTSVHKILRAEKVDVFHNLTNYGIIRSPCPVVTTVHDLLTLRYPHLRSTRLHWFLYRFFLPHLLRASQCITADSQSTRLDLKNLMGIEHDVRVVYLGYDPSLFHPTQLESDRQLLEKYQLDPDYLLFVGYLTPKKNVEVLLHALRRLQQDGVTPQLVLAGDWGYGSEPIRQLIGDFGLEAQVIETGFISKEEIAALYRRCSLFLFPSFFEGFGLPVLEAMACGAAVLVSSAGPPPEIVGQQKYTSDPERPELWAEKIKEFLDNPDYAEQARQWSVQRAQSFSWTKTARELRGIYDLVSEKTSDEGL